MGRQDGTFRPLLPVAETFEAKTETDFTLFASHSFEINSSVALGILSLYFGKKSYGNNFHRFTGLPKSVLSQVKRLMP